MSAVSKNWTYLGELGSVVVEVKVMRVMKKMIVLWAPD
jgi:hypothetical protein